MTNEETACGLPEEVFRRIGDQPYYSYLYALNILGGRLPASLEEGLFSDPRVAYLYALNVIGGSLPDACHNALVISCSGESSFWVSKYLEFVG